MTTSVVLVVHNQLALTRACLESLQATTRALRALRGGQRLRRRNRGLLPTGFARSYPLRYQRNAENVGLIRALNQGARLAAGDLLCFLHNDTEMREPALARAAAAARWRRPRASGWPASTACGGSARDGRYVGRTIVHCLEGAPTLARARGRRWRWWTASASSSRRDAPGRGRRLRRGLRLLPRLRPRSLLRGAGGGPALRGGGRALRAPGRRHAHGRARAAWRRRRTSPQRQAALARFAAEVAAPAALRRAAGCRERLRDWLRGPRNGMSRA